MMIARGKLDPDNAQPRTKTDVAYQVLRRAIVTGDIGPNEPLDENALLQRYQFGRTPLREALKRLHPRAVRDLAAAFDSLLCAGFPPTSWQNFSRPGSFRGTGQPDSRERHYRRATRPAGGISARIEELIAAGEIYQAVEADHALHLAIAQASGNRFLAEAVSNLNCGSLRLWYTAHERAAQPDRGPRHST